MSLVISNGKFLVVDGKFVTATKPSEESVTPQVNPNPDISGEVDYEDFGELL